MIWSEFSYYVQGIVFFIFQTTKLIHDYNIMLIFWYVFKAFCQIKVSYFI